MSLMVICLIFPTNDVNLANQNGGENIAPAPFWLAKSIRVWKTVFAKVLVGAKFSRLTP